MQSATAPSEIGTPKIIRRKTVNPIKFYLIRFSILFISVFCITLIICNFFVLSPENTVSDAIKSYLKNPFSSCVYTRDYISAVFDMASPDMFQLAILLILGFTMLCSPSCGAVIIYRAVSIGLCTSYLHSYLLVKSSGAAEIALAWIFVAAYILSSFVICAFSAATCSLSLEIKSTFSGGFRRKFLKQGFRMITLHVVRFLTFGGSIIIIRLVQTILFAVISG